MCYAQHVVRAPTTSWRGRRLSGVVVGPILCALVALGACRNSGPVSVFISPGAATAKPDGVTQLHAAASQTLDAAVTWSVKEGDRGGTVSSTGLYTAPSSPGVYHVVASSRLDPAWSATAAIHVGLRGCERTGPTGLQSKTIEANGKQRRYLLFVPPRSASSGPLAVVFFFHGLGGDGADSRAMAGLEAQSAGSAIFVYPDGIRGGWDLRDGGDDVLLFDRVVDSLMEDYCVDMSRIFAAGFSYGGVMSNMLGCYRGQSVRAIASAAGAIIPAVPACRGHVAAWNTFGVKDNDYKDYAEHIRDFWLAQNNCGISGTPLSPAPCEAYSCPVEGFDVVWCRHERGHEWPAFAPEAVWSFFDGFR